MKIKTIVDEDFTNYKKPSMVVAFPNCTFKCERECGKQVCQNGALATAPTIEVNTEHIVNRYLNNNITSAIVMAGLEPFDTYKDLKELIISLRDKTEDDVVIFTGYNKNEVESYINELASIAKNIVVKFGRYVPDCKSYYDEVLGIFLVSDNQYAERIS